MEKTFLGFNFSVKRKENNPTLDDVKAINDSVIDYILSLSNENINDRINECVVDSEQSDFSNLINSKLDDLGIVISNETFNLKDIESANGELEKIRGRINDFLLSNSQIKEDSDILFQRGTSKLKGYSELSTYGKTVVRVRDGQDEGMIDIFNIDMSCLAFKNILNNLKQSREIEALTSTRKNISPRNINVYLNSGIQNTRGFHVDTYEEKLKAFIYLTDCLDFSDGPYTFVKKSHKRSSFSTINKYLSSSLPNHTESPVVPFSEIVPVLAPKGSLVISDQCGIHRGFPQSPEGRRAVAVLSFH